jgi:hypothetical protein
MEAADPTSSIGLAVRWLFWLGVSRKQVASSIAPPRGKPRMTVSRLRRHFRTELASRLRRLLQAPSPLPKHWSALQTEWPDDEVWPGMARPCTDFRLDAGYEVTEHFPSWMLPIGD